MMVGWSATLRCWRQSRCALLLIALIFIAPIALHAPNSPNFLAYAPLLPLIALFFGLGVTTLYHSLPHSTRRIAVLGLVALLIFNVVWAARDLFVNWASSAGDAASLQRAAGTAGPLHRPDRRHDADRDLHVEPQAADQPGQPDQHAASRADDAPSGCACCAMPTAARR